MKACVYPSLLNVHYVDHSDRVQSRVCESHLETVNSVQMPALQIGYPRWEEQDNNAYVGMKGYCYSLLLLLNSLCRSLTEHVNLSIRALLWIM